jgi:hypothetical protein
MRTGNGGGKIKHAKARKALCQNPLIAISYRHPENSACVPSAAA